jgi:predicted S18 family serine protease
MAIVLDGTTGITTPDLASGPVAGTTANFSGNATLGASVLATPTGSAPAYLCRAWVNFNGTGTVAIRASGNVSSITDGGTGTYTVNFTTAMSDTNYAAVGSAGNVVGGFGQGVLDFKAYTTSSLLLLTTFGISGQQDSTFTNVAIFR